MPRSRSAGLYCRPAPILRPLMILLLSLLLFPAEGRAQQSAEGAAFSAPSPEGDAVSPQEVAAVWERLKRLDGKWTGKSTKGWEEQVSYRMIAAGSVMMGTSFDAHPDETMVTMYHLDGERLMLTHYCVAKNQPRLQLTDVSQGGKVVTFTFLDATGMPDRDTGHMDSVVFRFQDDDHFSSRWTWYQDGESRWMEEILCTRIR